MFTISLSPEEGEIIREALHSQHNTLLHELSKADSLEFKEGLRRREAVISKVMQQLEPSAPRP
jgi:hypothetical protein